MCHRARHFGRVCLRVIRVSVSVREDASPLRECPRGDSPVWPARPGVAGSVLPCPRLGARWLRVHVRTWGAGRAPPPEGAGG